MNKKVSVIIPCRNEEKYISKCIESVVNSDYPQNRLEVLISDGLSNDKTQEIIKHFIHTYPYIKLLINKKKTTPHALNLGIKNSNGGVVIILGAHAEIQSDYISNCVELLNKNTSVGCVGGHMENIYEDKRSKVISLAMSSVFGVGNAHFRTGNKEGYVDTVAFGAYKRDVLDKIGLFDEELTRNQDDELNYRLIKAGAKIYLSKDIKSKYYVRAAYDKLFRQYYSIPN